MNTDPIKRLVAQLSRLPGIGERTALRLALYLVQEKKELVSELAESLISVANNISVCTKCYNLATNSDLCPICHKDGRDQGLICVVSCVQDLVAIEASGSFTGLYHVLSGVLQPMKGIGPADIKLELLLARLEQNTSVQELIIATPATVEGEATALLIAAQCNKFATKVTRIACGVPVGGDLQYADRLSLARSLAMRHVLS